MARRVRWVMAGLVLALVAAVVPSAPVGAEDGGEPTTGTIEVTVLDGGAPAPGRYVDIDKDGTLTAMTDLDGRAVFAGLEPGAWTVMLEDELGQFEPQIEVVEVVAGEITEVTLEVISLEGSIVVEAVATGWGFPVEGVEVEVFDSTGWYVWTKSTGPDGLAVFDGLIEGTYSIEIPEAREYLTRSVVRGEVTHVTVEVDAAPVPGAVEITVLDEDGGPIEGAWISMTSIHGTWQHDRVGWTGEDGVALFTDVAVDSYGLEIHDPRKPYEYFGSVSVQPGQTAVVEVVLPDPPANDDFVDAIEVEGPSGSVDGSNVAGTREAGEPGHGSSWNGASVWYRWVAPEDGFVTFSTCGSELNALVAVYVGNGVDALHAVTRDQDGCGDSGAAGFLALAGTTYHVAIDGIGTPWWMVGQGSFTLEWSMVEVDDAIEVVRPDTAVATDPTSGVAVVPIASGTTDDGDLTVTFPTDCPAGADPEVARVTLRGVAHDATSLDDGTARRTTTLPIDLQPWRTEALAWIEVRCPDLEPTRTPVAQISIFEPWGIVVDGVTGEPLADAEVLLTQVPGWVPRTSADDDGVADTCESGASVPDGAAWSQPAPVELGVAPPSADPRLAPKLNPMHTDGAGRFGWSVPEGCWYVAVAAPGHLPAVSPVVGAPPAIEGLDVALTPLTEPEPPTDVVATVDDTTVTVGWTAPESDGGSPITGYTVTADPGGASCTTDGALSCSITGLPSGVATTFTVVATNDVGDSPPSAPSDPVTIDPPPLPTTCGADQPGPFDDVTGVHTFCEPIDWLTSTGITTGFPDGTFRPTVAVSRQAMAAFLWRAAGEPEVTLTEAFFTDVDPDHPFFTPIQWMAQAEISTGTPSPDGPAYKPTDGVSRQAMAAFLWRSAGNSPAAA